MTLRSKTRAACGSQYAHWSRSYCGNISLAAGWSSRVGVDISRTTPTNVKHFCEHLEDFLDVTATPNEREMLASLAVEDVPSAALDLWGAKEALTKALGNALDYNPAQISSPLMWSGGCQGSWYARRISLPEEIVESDAQHGVFIGWIVFESTEAAPSGLLHQQDWDREIDLFLPCSLG